MWTTWFLVHSCCIRGDWHKTRVFFYRRDRPASTWGLKPNRDKKIKKNIIEMAHIWMLTKVKCTLVYIAIHQATQCHQHYCSMWCCFWDIVTFVLMTAIFKNGGRESQNMPNYFYLKSLSHITYMHTPKLFLKMKQLLPYGEMNVGGHY